VEKFGAGSASRVPISAMSTTDAEWGEHIGDTEYSGQGYQASAPYRSFWGENGLTVAGVVVVTGILPQASTALLRIVLVPRCARW
jgi:hypothetical protein